MRDGLHVSPSLFLIGSGSGSGTGELNHFNELWIEHEKSSRGRIYYPPWRLRSAYARPACVFDEPAPRPLHKNRSVSGWTTSKRNLETPEHDSHYATVCPFCCYPAFQRSVYENENVHPLPRTVQTTRTTLAYHSARECRRVQVELRVPSSASCSVNISSQQTEKREFSLSRCGCLSGLALSLICMQRDTPHKAGQ
ncbi:hypothetical protein Bbelb_435200 [Branchiostoma belcheri]|nr:hypothetical protein Bbelb_435200 [Branchiostoma belcheri]